MWRRQSTTEVLKWKKNFKCTVLKQDLQNTGECFTVKKKNGIQDILTGISR